MSVSAGRQYRNLASGAQAHLKDQGAFGLIGVAGRVGEAALVRAVDLVGQDVQQHLPSRAQVGSLKLKDAVQGDLIRTRLQSSSNRHQRMAERKEVPNDYDTGEQAEGHQLALLD